MLEIVLSEDGAPPRRVLLLVGLAVGDSVKNPASTHV